MIPYCGPAPVPLDLWSRWNWDPWVMGGLLAAAALGHWLALRRPEYFAARQRLAGGTAWLLLAVLFISPLCALTTALFAARVAHHVLLFGLAAPLLVLAAARWIPAGTPGPAILAGAFTVQLVAVWMWHAPGPYAAALASDALYWVMQASLLGGAILFWVVIVAARRRRLGGLFMLLGTVVHMGLLGAIIAFAPQPLYDPHAVTTQPWGLTPLADQQLGGLIMWIPAVLPYLVALIPLSLPMLRPLMARPER